MAISDMIIRVKPERVEAMGHAACHFAGPP